MLPVYFPFTSVSPRWMNASNGFFKTMTVYQMSAASIPERMQAWQADKRLDIRLPVQQWEKEVFAILKEFRMWAQHHHGGDISFFKTSKGDIPFFDDSSVARIRQDIKAGGAGKTAAGKTESPDLRPAVFLQMAQELDEKNREIAGDLESQALKAQELIKALKGDDGLDLPGDAGSGTTDGDGETYMISERMAAWARMMLGDGLLPSLLVTSSPMALDDLVERAVQGSQEILSLPTVMAPKGDAAEIARCQDALADYLTHVSAAAWQGKQPLPALDWGCEAAAAGARLSLHVIPGMTPRTLLGRYLVQRGQDAPNQVAGGDSSANTVLGVLEP